MGFYRLKKNAPMVLAVMLATILFSNGIVALFSYGVMRIIGGGISCDSSNLSIVAAEEVTSLIDFKLPMNISAVYALLAAIALGLIGSFYILGIEQGVSKIKDWIESFLCDVIIPFLPLLYLLLYYYFFLFSFFVYSSSFGFE